MLLLDDAALAPLLQPLHQLHERLLAPLEEVQHRRQVDELRRLDLVGERGLQHYNRRTTR
jgi:hypothetical protein